MSNIKIGLGVGLLLLLLIISYFVYDYGYTKGEADKQLELDAVVAEYQQKARQQATKISQAEQQLAESAMKYEQLRSSYDQVLEDNKQWASSHVESQNRSLSLATVHRLNSLLQSRQ